MNRQQVQIDVALDDGKQRQTVTGYVYPDCPGLALTPMIENGVVNDAFWVVTHIPTGYAVVPWAYGRIPAEGVLVALGAIGIDWTGPADDVFSIPNAKRVYDAIRDLL
jgi:nitroreductase